MIRDALLIVAVAGLMAAAVALYGSPAWRREPCESRWDACRAALERSGDRVAWLTNQLERCR